MLKKYLGLSEMEIAENDKMWHEERGTEEPTSKLQGSDLRTVGVTPGAIGTDLETVSDIEAAQGGGGAPGGPLGAPPIGGEVGAAGVPSPTGGAGGGAGGGATAGAALGGA